jgi:hypothetical protein
MSSPSTLNNPHNPYLINHLPQKNSWHSSFPPTRIIKGVEMKIEKPGDIAALLSF